MLVGAGVGGSTAFTIFAGVALAGAVVTLLVPRRESEPFTVDAPLVSEPEAAAAGSTVTG